MNGTDPDAVGIIGGTGFYDFVEADPAAHPVEIDTPFGAPSAPPVVGTLDGRRVVFLPRHGAHHEYLPHQVPYRANLWALRALGVRAVIAAAAVGSLDPAVGPGALVVPDQLIDRTQGRATTFFDRTSTSVREHDPVHIGFADPYCPRLRATLCDPRPQVGDSGPQVVDGATMMVIDGPRFSTRAESRMYAAWGASLINMTGQPEASLCRELGICYATLCLVTDLDAGVAPGDGVAAADVFAEFARNLPRLKERVAMAVAGLSSPAGCDCARVNHDVDAMLSTVSGTSTASATPTPVATAGSR
ncbi:S-methyl-5'-thioadenosine phosphorylase [Gordonia sp. DT219]|uniref:S-methyl-5'-thioadenosine phosphorylase n=1 Tax=Gordonia sp. DT219 TaxID=3416658 RepID=UPI003CEDAC36